MSDLIVNPYSFAGTSDPGHAGVAAWVAANSSDVLAYYPMSDASASGTMSDDSGNGRDGTYGSGMTTTTIDTYTVADFQNSSLDRTEVADAAWMDTVIGEFAVVRADTHVSGGRMITARDEGSSGSRRYQFRTFGTGGRLDFVKIGGTGGTDTTVSTTNLTAGVDYTVGWTYDGSNVRLYINGSLDVTRSHVGALASSTAKQTVGWRNDPIGYNDFDGGIGSLVMLSAFTSDTIPDLHNAWDSGY